MERWGRLPCRGTSGEWQVFYGPESNGYLALYGHSGPPFDEKWGWCNSTQTCAEVGYSWQLTLASETPEAPEPTTAVLLMGVLLAFGVRRVGWKADGRAEARPYIK
jgi:hypothetical protein